MSFESIRFFIQITIAILALIILANCSSNNGTNTPSSNNTSSSSSSSGAPSLNKMINGTITFDYVPTKNTEFGGLDYAMTQARPARGVLVEALNSSETLITHTTTNQLGEYQLTVPSNTSIKIRVHAKINTFSGITVKDNTSSNLPYVLDGNLVDSGSELTQTRNLHAPSGWTGNGYSKTRSAAPFAILNTIQDALDILLQADDQLSLPALDIFWSPLNVAVDGNMQEGQIGTTFYSVNESQIWVLGQANNDTDEYDRHVIAHEFWHFLEDSIFRSDSIGGTHSPSKKLDMRISFSEGFGNAASTIFTGAPQYKDTLMFQQQVANQFNIETQEVLDPGYYNEASIQSAIYDLYDDNIDNGDTINLSFKVMYDTLTSSAYLNFEGVASIYSFLAELKKQTPSQSTLIDELFTRQNITATDAYGNGETNSPNPEVTLPLYRTITIGQTINVCSDNTTQDFNGADISRFILFSAPNNQNYTISAVRNGGSSPTSNPAIDLYEGTNLRSRAYNGTPDSETLTFLFKQSTYLIIVADEFNKDNSQSTGGKVCFDISIN